MLFQNGCKINEKDNHG